MILAAIYSTFTARDKVSRFDHWSRDRKWYVNI